MTKKNELLIKKCDFTTKTAFQGSLGKSFQEVFKMIDNWISEGSSWVTESTDGANVNDSIYSLLSGCSYVKLPDKLRNSKKDLINITNGDNKCLFWCHFRNSNPLETHPERVTKFERQMVDKLDYGDVNFPVSKKNYRRL